MAKYKLLQDAFIAPYLYRAGTIISYKGPPGLAFEPVDDEAKAAKAAYVKANPGRGEPIERLPIRTEDKPVVTAIHGAGPLAPQPNTQTGGVLGMPGAAQPDLAMRGVVTDSVPPTAPPVPDEPVLEAGVDKPPPVVLKPEMTLFQR